MKTLWNVVSFLAVVHLLAILMMVAWLWQGDRLSVQRIEDVRAVFATTVGQASAAAQKAVSQAHAERLRQMDEAQKADPSMDSPAQIQYLGLIRQHEEQARRRLEDERKAMLQQLATAAEQVEGGKQELNRERNEWEAAMKNDRQRKIDEQFLQTIKQYEQVTPKQGKKMLMELVTNNHADQAVAYLDAMNPRAASKILKEFKTDQEIALATELLEKLRTFGATPPPATVPAPALGATRAATRESAPQEPSSHANGLARTP